MPCLLSSHTPLPQNITSFAGFDTDPQSRGIACSRALIKKQATLNPPGRANCVRDLPTLSWKHAGCCCTAPSHSSPLLYLPSTTPVSFSERRCRSSTSQPPIESRGTAGRSTCNYCSRVEEHCRRDSASEPPLQDEMRVECSSSSMGVGYTPNQWCGGVSNDWNLVGRGIQSLQTTSPSPDWKFGCETRASYLGASLTRKKTDPQLDVVLV